MKIYTKMGDKGTTMLANGTHILKSSLRIEAYGTVDELNAHIGHFRDCLASDKRENPMQAFLSDALFRIQEELFEIGAELALSPVKMTRIASSCTSVLEKEIDKMWASVPPLKNFVLPGGHLANSQGHICRCVCRRAERALCNLNEEEPVRHELLIYFNRLSDWLFASCRVVHLIFGVEELIWKTKA